MGLIHDWFGLGRCTFAVLPRVLMEAMPDDWQEKMVHLLDEYEETFDTSKLGIASTTVRATDSKGKLMSMPEELLRYRHPDKEFINRVKII
jgi:hypothetical protein